jgi:DNA replicative helicase MCM subunit Mcm2 (Cdc46/Mcm family)
MKQFAEISRKLVRNEVKKTAEADTLFVRQYVDYASKLNVKFSKDLEEEVVAFAEKLKTNEKAYLTEISPRIVVGLMNLAKASARLELRESVTSADLERVTALVEKSLSLG